MTAMSRSTAVALLGAAAVLGGCRARREVVVFHAASLTRSLGDAAQAFERETGVHVRLEPSGSQVAIRKVTELSMRADLVFSADAALLERLMLPGHARWTVELATNELVVAHKDHSAFTDEIGPKTWPEILQRPKVRLGRANPDTAPLGFHTLFAWQLAERSGGYGEAGRDLLAKLVARTGGERLAPDENELLAHLEARALDYAFLYRSTAEDHHLKLVELPAAENLSRRDLAAEYAAATTDVHLGAAGEVTRIAGAPVVSGFTVPLTAPHPADAVRFAAFLVGERGERILRARGFHPLRPALTAEPAALPPELQPLTARSPR